MTPEQIKQYFIQNPPPQSVNWKPHAKITDTKTFLNHTFVLIESHKGKLDDLPAWWRLKEFYTDMLKLREGENKEASPNHQEG